MTPGLNSRLLAAAGLGLVGLLIVVVAVLGFRPGSGGDAAAAPSATPAPSESAAPTVPDIFRQVGPSVVVIRTTQEIGTGVIAAANGMILTANHVIAGATGITITFADGTTTAATVVAANPVQDVAALAPVSLPEIVVPAALGGGVEVGAPVVAIGNPLGLTYSVSSGVVSGLERSASNGLSGLIQFDASINPGSSGGPLLDANGLVVGIVVAIADPGGDDAFAGIGFAVPIDAALSGGDGVGPDGGPQI